MGAPAVGVDRVAETEGCVDADIVDDPLRPHVEELHPSELSTPGLALEDRLVEQRRLRAGLVSELPPQLRVRHAASLGEHVFVLLHVELDAVRGLEAGDAVRAGRALGWAA